MVLRLVNGQVPLRGAGFINPKVFIANVQSAISYKGL
jgi:hypothetical protein